MKFKKLQTSEKFKPNFSRQKVKTMKFFHFKENFSQSPRKVKTPEKNSNIKTVDTVFKTWDNILFQLLKNLVVGMPKLVFEVNRKKLSLL